MNRMEKQPDFSATVQNNRKKPSFLDNNRIRMVISVVSAVLVWIIVTIAVQPETTVSLSGVPVDFNYDSATYTAKGLSIVNAPTETVSLNISGDGYIIGDMTQDDFVVYPDYTSVKQSGEKTLRLRVKCLSADADNITVTIAGTNNTVYVVFDSEVEKKLPIEVVTQKLSIQEGYLLFKTASTAETVTLTGPSGEMNRITSCKAVVVYEDPLDTTRVLLTPLTYYNEDGQEIKPEYVKSDRDEVEVTITVYKLTEIPISINFINTPPDFDKSILKYSLSQETLKVSGSESAVGKVSSISIGSIDLSTFTLDRIYEIPIHLPQGVYSQENVSSVKVSFDCSELAVKTLNLPVECVQVINLPVTYQLTVESDRLMNVQLCGPKEVLDGLTAEQVVAEINADQLSIALGQQNIACNIYVPASNQVFALGSYSVQCRIESN